MIQIDIRLTEEKIRLSYRLNGCWQRTRPLEELTMTGGQLLILLALTFSTVDCHQKKREGHDPEPEELSGCVRTTSIDENGVWDNNFFFEYHFDGDNDASGAVYDSSNRSQQGIFCGDAKRSAISDGKYGRSLLLDGDGDFVRMDDRIVDPATHPFPGSVDTRQPLSLPLNVMGWVRPDDLTGIRPLLSKKGSFSIFFDDDKLSARIHTEVGDSDGPDERVVTAMPFEVGKFQQFVVSVFKLDGAIKVAVLKDPEPADYDAVKLGACRPDRPANCLMTEVSRLVPVTNDAPILIGGEDSDDGFYSFNGMIDELIWATYLSTSDYTPLGFTPNCPDSAVDCQEYVKTFQQQGLTDEMGDAGYDVNPGIEVPVRTFVARPETCTKASPCKAIVMAQGGGNCSDGFPPTEQMDYWVKQGYVVVAALSLCADTANQSDDSASSNFEFYNVADALAQAVKDLLGTLSFVSYENAHDYYATGGSNGAALVAYLALAHPYWPKRTYSASFLPSGTRAVYESNYAKEKTGNKLVTPYLNKVDSAAGVSARIPELPVETQEALYSALKGPMLDLANDSQERKTWYQEKRIAGRGEILISWGVEEANPAKECFEEDMGFIDSNREFRTFWELTDPVTGPNNRAMFMAMNYGECQSSHAYGNPKPAAKGGDLPLFVCAQQFFENGANDPDLEALCQNLSLSTVCDAPSSDLKSKLLTTVDAKCP